MQDMRLLIQNKNQTATITDGLLAIPIHAIHAYSKGVMFCSISDPETLDNVQINVPSMTYLTTDANQPVFLQENNGKQILHIDLAACTFQS